VRLALGTRHWISGGTEKGWCLHAVCCCDAAAGLASRHDLRVQQHGDSVAPQAMDQPAPLRG
jgi:hypothetical protein